MAEGYIHYEITRSQASMREGEPNGDVMGKLRTPQGTTIVLADGIGHGVKAHIAAQFTVSRALGLIEGGTGIRSAFESIVRTMEEAKGTDMPYAVVTMVRILPDGFATVLSYEMPPPILMMRRFSQILPQRPVSGHESAAMEASCHLSVDESLLIVTDGVTQSGMGGKIRGGWTSEGLLDYVIGLQEAGTGPDGYSPLVLSKALANWGHKPGDDCSAITVTARKGNSVTVLTGPPSDRRMDRRVLARFMASDGFKVVSGGSTAKMVASYLGKDLKAEKGQGSLYSPPRYFIDGIDLVTEGALTLNQVCNVIDEQPEQLEEGSVAMLHRLLIECDKVTFLVGEAANPANSGIAFRQQGILARKVIIPVLCEKLRVKGKLVIEERI